MGGCYVKVSFPISPCCRDLCKLSKLLSFQLYETGAIQQLLLVLCGCWLRMVGVWWWVIRYFMFHSLFPPCLKVYVNFPKLYWTFLCFHLSVIYGIYAFSMIAGSLQLYVGYMFFLMLSGVFFSILFHKCFFFLN